MKKIFLYTLCVSLSLFSCTNNNKLSFQTDDFKIIISDDGQLSGIKDINSKKDYLAKDTAAPFMQIRIHGEVIPASSIKPSDTPDQFLVGFPNEIQLKIKATENKSHLRFEILEALNAEEVELICWGPYPTTIRKIIGETVGVVRGETYAIGLQALNPKTLGGFPWTDNDCMPQFDIFESGNYSDMSEQGKRHVLYRIEAAKPEKFGSTLQAYCRNRNKVRITNNLNHDKYTVPVFDDGGITGSAIALFGCPVEETLDHIGEIEVSEGLPHPTIDGEWGKKARSASAAYLIMGFGEDNVDEAIEITKKAGLRYLYHPGPFMNWGHFELNQQFPNGWDGLKECVEKANQAGLFMGLHTLSNFITTNDPWVSPVPDPRLAKVGSSVIAAGIDARQTEIPIQSPDFFNQFKNNHLRTVMIEEELIRYGGVSDSEPWTLYDCQRGAFNTKASSHKENTEISKLTDHGYKVFLTNPELSLEMSDNIARLYNYCGLQQISFDGLEGNRSTGMGNYGEILFTNNWYEKINPELRKHMIIDASRTSHYFWHIYSRMNWGEPWYAGFRESQTEYRLKNQKYFSRNLMPGMLGWFSMRPNTSVEDIEWMLARSAAFNAGYAFVCGFDALKNNGNTPKILELIKIWEEARMTDIFNNEQKDRMKDVKQEFHLEKINEKKWNLTQVYPYIFAHKKITRQPGEPLFSEFEFDNQNVNQDFCFTLHAINTDLSGILLELDHYKEIKFDHPVKKGQIVQYTGGNSVDLYDNNWNKIKTIPVNQDEVLLSKGKHKMKVDCTFIHPSEDAQLKIEIRVNGSVEEISVK